jgi:putative SOS response-associated peptidase YedK
MCGRYVLKAGIKELKKKYHAEPEFLSDLKPDYNVSPTSEMPVICQKSDGIRVISRYRWGLVPFWAKEINTGYSMFNARAESLPEKRTFKKAFQTQRCIVPANGFYEWVKRNNSKIPFYITLENDELMSFAGLYEHWKGNDGQVVNSFTIITTTVNKKLEPIHDRMPAILLDKEIDIWLDPGNEDIESLQDLIHPYPDDNIRYHEVSTDVNNSRNQGPELIKPNQNLFS